MEALMGKSSNHWYVWLAEGNIGVKDQQKILLVSKKIIQKDQTNIYIGIKNISPETHTLINHWAHHLLHIAHQLLSSLTQMLIPMRRSPDCYCTYVGVSAFICGCMHVRTCACMSVSVCMNVVSGCMHVRAHACISVCMSACTCVLKQHSSTGRVLLLPEGPKTRTPT